MAFENKVNYSCINKEILESIKLPTKYLAIRRVSEIVFILLISPLIIIIMLITTILIKITSPGPIFFVQKRLGINNTIFNIYKFRTMKHNSVKELNTIVHIESNIPKLGKFLRTHRIDEIPQFFNILKGDMSLFGPRPEALFFSQKCMEQIPFYQYRLIVKPGLTGWAQVWFKHTDDVRGSLSKFEYDVYYLMNISFKTDIKILLRSFIVIFSGTGAK